MSVYTKVLPYCYPWDKCADCYWASLIDKNQLAVVSVNGKEFDRMIESMLRATKLTLTIKNADIIGHYGETPFFYTADRLSCQTFPVTINDASTSTELFQKYANFVKAKINPLLSRSEATKEFFNSFWDKLTLEKYKATVHREIQSV